MVVTYNCKCEKCGKITTVPINPNDDNSDLSITAYGYLKVRCCFCDGEAYATWRGFDKKRPPITGF